MQFYKKGLIVFGLIFLVVYISFRFTYAWYMDPSSCKKCHEVEPYHASWQESPHKNIDCMDCHKTRGPFHRLDTTFRGIKNLSLHIKGEYFSFRAVYYDTNCINCHTGNFKSETNAPLMPKNHAKLIKNGVGCNNCHRDTGHKNGLGVDKKFDELAE
ncbi:hypothetical protein JCM17380_14950 [Desulfosporosinus burensis]